TMLGSGGSYAIISAPATSASVITHIDPPVAPSEVHALTFGSNPSGTFVLSIGGQQTAPIPYADNTDADPLGLTIVDDYAPLVANVQRALEDMLGPGNTLVLVSPNSTVNGAVLTIQYSGALAGTYLPIVIANEVQKLSFSATPSSGTFKIKLTRPDGAVVTTGDISINSNQNTTATN